jgi:hypothetical protein
VKTFADFKEMAATLPLEQRASLASFLLKSLPDSDYDVSDEEVAQRVSETQSGEVSTISMEELREGVFADRRRCGTTIPSAIRWVTIFSPNSSDSVSNWIFARSAFTSILQAGDAQTSDAFPITCFSTKSRTACAS